MSRRAWLLFFAVSSLTCVYLIIKMQPAQAQRASAVDNPARPRWEYCAIIRSSSMNENDMAVGVATIAFFDASGYREETVRAQGERITSALSGEYQRAQEKALAMTIAQLGSQGWEMIGHFPYNGALRAGADEITAIYFKRAKQ
jgi:hypothetical protein